MKNSLNFVSTCPWRIGKALKKWLRTTIQAAKPWMSEGDIQAGTQWLEEIDKALGLKLGIICLAPDNLTAPWIHFEAGALSKALQLRARVCPYLLGGLEKEQVDFPLARFQMAKADKDGTLSLIRSINAHVAAEPLADEELQTLFEERWPKLEKELSAIPAPSGTPPPDPPVPQTVAKTYELLRTLAGPIRDIAAETEIAGVKDSPSRNSATRSQTSRPAATLWSQGIPVGTYARYHSPHCAEALL